MRWAIIFSFVGFLSSTVALGAKESRIFSIQSTAMAPNSGGQDTYSLRYFKKDKEYSLFSNQYLLTGDYPLTGAIMSHRYDICSGWCPIKSFVQVGAGISTGGPLVEFLWNVTPFWLLRVDFATHFYVIGERAMVWSYPLWVGISVPF